MEQPRIFTRHNLRMHLTWPSGRDWPFAVWRWTVSPLSSSCSLPRGQGQTAQEDEGPAIEAEEAEVQDVVAGREGVRLQMPKVRSHSTKAIPSQGQSSSTSSAGQRDEINALNS